MKISLIGTHETGKTTLFESLKGIPEFKDFHHLSEVVQDFNWETVSSFEYLRIQEQVIEKQIIIEKLHNNIITDRSVVDNFAYLVSRLMYAFPQKNIESALIKIQTLTPKIFELATESFSTYDLLFYIPIEFELKEPTPYKNLHQGVIDEIIKFLIRHYNIETRQLNGSVEQRKEALIEIYHQTVIMYEIK